MSCFPLFVALPFLSPIPFFVAPQDGSGRTGASGVPGWHRRIICSTIVILVLLFRSELQATQVNAASSRADEAAEEEFNKMRSPLQLAIVRGMDSGGDLSEEVRKLKGYKIRSREDARAICEALSKLPSHASRGNGISSPLHALTGLFQNLADSDVPAFDVLRVEGIPQLIRIFDARVRQGDKQDYNDLFFVLKILAAYRTREGVETVVEAAQQSFNADGDMWHVVLSGFAKSHPHRDFVFEALSDPLPKGVIAVALLDSANRASIRENLQKHPFDSPAGLAQLQRWLEDRNPDSFAAAHSATAALPFVSKPARDQLLAFAMDHADVSVQMEAAWAAGKLGRESGLKILARYCLEVNSSDIARTYLKELDREDIIPVEALQPSFLAKAELARWLSHPNELGKPPDQLEIVDERRLAWPPNEKAKPFWLIRYRLQDRTGLEEDDVGFGLVGSTTWCFFSYDMHQRSPEDAYAIHCYWEMEHADLIKETTVSDASEYAGMLNQWDGNPVQGATITRVAELSPKLHIRQSLVALASGRLAGNDGWLVLDGPRSTWYPKSEQPEETNENAVLMIHVGRQLLGFQVQTDRQKYLIAKHPGRTPDEIVSAYEKLMLEAAGASPKRQKELLGGWSVLSKHFDAYTKSLAAVRKKSASEALVDAGGRFLLLAEHVDPSIRDGVYASTSHIGGIFDPYVDALASSNRSAEIPALIELFAPHCENNLGYNRLGRAAFIAGKRDVAEKYFMKLHEDLGNSYRFEQLSLLAEIWHDRGEKERARGLLIDCMRKLAAEIKKSDFESTRKSFSDTFHHFRNTYLRLDPNGEEELAKSGISCNP